jgi:quercetin dioxygenase-like cupin family protein
MNSARLRWIDRSLRDGKSGRCRRQIEQRSVVMQTAFMSVISLLAVLGASAAFAQPGPATGLVVTAEDIAAVVSAPGGGDREIRIVDLGRYNLGVAVLRRGAITPGGTIAGINHTKVTEVYYVVSGEGTLVMGGDVKDVKPLAADNELVTTVVGPSNNATFVKPTTIRRVKTGDVVIIPAGVYHGFSEVADHIEYVSVRPDLEKVLPAGYVNPALKK